MSAAGTWLPIESAPRDGTWVLLGAVGVPDVWSGKWHYVGPRAGSRWESLIGRVPFEPTHWQPLPEPPVAGGERQ